MRRLGFLASAVLLAGRAAAAVLGSAEAAPASAVSAGTASGVAALPPSYAASLTGSAAVFAAAPRLLASPAAPVGAPNSAAAAAVAAAPAAAPASVVAPIGAADAAEPSPGAALAEPEPLVSPGNGAPLAAPERAAPPLGGGEALRPLDELFDGSLAAGAVAGVENSRVALLSGPEESLDARVSLLSGAKGTVYAGYYRFSPDAAGLAKLAQLRSAARRGVAVRLVLDAWGSDLPKAVLKHLVDEGVEVRFYHPFRLAHPSWFLRRSHDKWTIVDGEEAILGDSNMGKHYFGMGGKPWTSREAYVAGPAAREAHAYVERLWESGEALPPRGLERVPAAEAAAAGRRLDAFDAHYARRAAYIDYALKPWAARAHDAPARFSSNALNRPRNVAGTGHDLLRMIRRARHTVVIENAYVVLPKVFRIELEKAVKRGVRVVIVTNSKTTNNLRAARLAYEDDVPRLVRMGAELYEFDGPGTLHAKSLVVDGQHSYLGSFNFDPRSLRLNTETGVIVRSRGFALDLLRQIERSRLRSTLVGWKGRWVAPRRGIPVLSALRALLLKLLLMLGRGQI